MTLFETIKDLTTSGYKVMIECEGLHLVVRLQVFKGANHQKYSDESSFSLPISDHFYEEKLVAMLGFQKERLDSFINSKENPTAQS